MPINRSWVDVLLASVAESCFVSKASKDDAHLHHMVVSVSGTGGSFPPARWSALALLAGEQLLQACHFDQDFALIWNARQPTKLGMKAKICAIADSLNLSLSDQVSFCETCRFLICFGRHRGFCHACGVCPVCLFHTTAHDRTDTVLKDCCMDERFLFFFFSAFPL
mmetsp:Transcript_411/g.3103  ORF Transcript_411/g.3103 Transcript_411/m.3103 type:complete len:166 (-) Transcript_411:88-585(-)